MDTSLNDLADDFRPLAFELLARCVEKRLPVIVIDTLRTPAEQQQFLAEGRSWTPNSRHLTGHAIDVCLASEYQRVSGWKPDWDGTNPDWQTLGEIGEGIGLVWGGRWTQRDLGHFEAPAPAGNTV